MNATLKDVALDAGVSVRTVSYVVNESDRISEETRERVSRSLERLGYQPNLAARYLKRGRSGMIALAVPELTVPYFAELSQAVLERARGLGVTVIIEQTNGRPELERQLFDTRSQLSDGVIISPLTLLEADIAELAHGRPVVMLGDRPGTGLLDHAAIDNAAAARMATMHLLSTGRRRIGVIGAQEHSLLVTAHERERGFRTAMASAGVEVDESLVASVYAYHRADGDEAMLKLLSMPDPPEAVLCFNDLLAVGALRAARRLGFSVPVDVAVIGIDDIEEGEYTSPTLSTIKPNKAALGRWAVDRVIDRIDERERQATNYDVPFTLLRRESS